MLRRSTHRQIHNSLIRCLNTQPPLPPPISAPFPFPPSRKPLPSFSTSNAESKPLTRTKDRITSVSQLPASFGANQIVPVPEKTREVLENIIKVFKAPVRFGFAYGSGVFTQAGYTAKDKPLLDFIFAVSHPSHWHAINMAQFPQHYSPLMRLLGSDAVAWMQEKGIGAGVWFNIGVEVNGKELKYGVISIDSLCRDLLDWETLYVSGRTQKPVRILVDDARVRLANQVNLASAFRTSLLLLPEQFTEIELYETIAGLSYKGDFRMVVGENPFKVKNIVASQLIYFRGLYGGLIKSFWRSVAMAGDHQGIKVMRQDISVSRKALTASKLPIGLRQKVEAYYNEKMNLRSALDGIKLAEVEVIDFEKAKMELWTKIVQDPEFTKMLQKSLGQIVAKPTFNQSLKGILSAGPLKSLYYIGPKLKKKWAGSSKPALIEEEKI